MWINTPIGFFSIVQDPGDHHSGVLTVHAGVRSDLASLQQRYLPGLGPIQESRDSDYRFRAVAPRAEVSAALARMVDELDYSHFKSEAGQRMGRDKQVIVVVGCEGGSVTLYGIQSPDGWQFRAETNEAALLDDEVMPTLQVRPWVATWRSALKQLDSYPWPELYPVEVHPDFRIRVFRALQARHKKDLSINWDRWDRVLKTHAK